MLRLLLKRDLGLAFFSKAYFFNSLALFIISTVIFAFISPHATINIILLPYIFSSLLSAPEIFQEDFNDSTLEQSLTAGYSNFQLVTAKILCHLLQSLLVLLITVPILCFIYNITLDHKLFYIYSVLLLLCISVSSLVTFAASLTLKINNGVIITCLIVMPLLITLLLYSASILNMTVAGTATILLLTDLKIMLAITLITSTIAVLACSYILTKI